MRWLVLLLVLVLLAAGIYSFWNRSRSSGTEEQSGALPAHPYQDVAESFLPQIEARNSKGATVELPKEYLGTAILVLVSYSPEADADLARWKTAVSSATGLQLIELDPNRGGSSEPPSSVIKLDLGREAAETLAAFTGNRPADAARVLLLNDLGEIEHYAGKGFSDAELEGLTTKAAQLQRPPR